MKTNGSASGRRGWRQSSPNRSIAGSYLLKRLIPAAMDYHSLLNPIFLADDMSTSVLGSRPVWLVRDGRLPLERFFAENPSPSGLHTHLLIHESLHQTIPKSWRHLSGSYSIVSEARGARGTWLILGDVDDRSIARLSMKSGESTITGAWGQGCAQRIGGVPPLPNRCELMELQDIAALEGPRRLQGTGPQSEIHLRRQLCAAFLSFVGNVGSSSSSAASSRGAH